MKKLLLATKLFFTLLFATCLFISTALAQSADDTQPPSDVEGVRATAGSESVTLRWEPATDDVGVVEYRIYMGTKPVKDLEDEYDLPTKTVKNKTKITIRALKNGKKYYFAVSAVDAAGNESENYSLEISAKPKARVSPQNDPYDPFSETVAPSSETIVPETWPNFPAEMAQIDIRAIGLVHRIYRDGQLLFYLYALDGKRYHLLSRANWEAAMKFSSKDFSGTLVEVAGHTVKNSFGKVFGISFWSLGPIMQQDGTHPPGVFDRPGIITARGVIHQRRANAFGDLGLYLYSEDDGRKFLLQNRPDWQRAWDFMLNKTRVQASGWPVYNQAGKLIGIRYLNLEED